MSRRSVAASSKPSKLETWARLPAAAFLLTLVLLPPPCPAVTLCMFLYVLLSSGRRFMPSNSE